MVDNIVGEIKFKLFMWEGNGNANGIVQITKKKGKKYKAVWLGDNKPFPIEESASNIYDFVKKLEKQGGVLSNTVPKKVWDEIELECGASKI